jgi:hypothetical protein
LFFLLFLAWCVRRCCSLFDALNTTTLLACSSTYVVMLQLWEELSKFKFWG